MLTDKTANIGEDFPKSIAYKRRKLFPVFAKAKKLPALANMNVSLKADVLSMGDRKYTVDALGQFQGELSMRTLTNALTKKWWLWMEFSVNFTGYQTTSKFP